MATHMQQTRKTSCCWSSYMTHRHLGYSRALSGLMLHTSSTCDKDECHRCCKFVNSFSAPVKLLQTQMFKRNHLTTKHPSVYPRLGQFFPSREFLFQACQKSPRTVWPLPDCNANRQSPLEFVSLEVIWRNLRMPTFLWVYVVPLKQFHWDKAALCKFTALKTTDILWYTAKKKTSGYILFFITIKSPE